MRCIRVLIIDSDYDFRRRFSTYLAGSGSRISITVMGLEIYESGFAVSNAGAFDLVVCDRDAYRPEVEWWACFRSIIVFVHSPLEEAAESGGQALRFVFKYQSMGSIMRMIPELVVAAELTDTGDRKQVRIITVGGFSGGCGRTAFSITLARIMRSRWGRSVLIISTGRMSDMYDYFPEPKEGEGYNLNMLILGHSCGSTADPERYILRDKYGVYCFALTDSMRSDLPGLSGEEVRSFMEFVKSWGIFDTIIVDAAGQADTDMTMYGMSQGIFLLTDNRRTSHRTENVWLRGFYRSVEEQRVTLVENFSGAETSIFEGYSSDDVTGEYDTRLPWDSMSFFRKDGLSDISMSGRYAGAVSMVAEKAGLI